MNTHSGKCGEPAFLFPGKSVAPDSDPETTDESGIIRGVLIPQIIPFLPPASKANRTSVLVCPGGGYALLDWR